MFCNSGGLSNYLYIASLPDNLQLEGKEPRKVLLRFYGTAQGDHTTILKDSLVFALLADRGLGPKFYGCFAGGRFEEYIPVCKPWRFVLLFLIHTYVILANFMSILIEIISFKSISRNSGSIVWVKIRTMFNITELVKTCGCDFEVFAPQSLLKTSVSISYHFYFYSWD